MKRFLLALALVVGSASVAAAQYPYYGYGPYYAPPVNYRYSYFYVNPSPMFPRGFSMYQYRATPAYYGPVYLNAWNVGYRW